MSKKRRISETENYISQGRTIIENAISQGRMETESFISSSSSWKSKESKSIEGNQETVVTSTSYPVHCGGYVLSQEMVSSVSNNSRVIDDYLNAYFSVFQDSRFYSIHTYFFQNLSRLGPEQVLRELHPERRLSYCIQKLEDAEYIFMPQQTPFPLGVGHWGLILLHKNSAIIQFYDSASSGNPFWNLMNIIKDWANTVRSVDNLRSWPSYCGVWIQIETFRACNQMVYHVE